MGRIICKECGKDSGDVTPFCDHCHARQYPEWHDKVIFWCFFLPVALAFAGCYSALWWKVIFYFVEQMAERKESSTAFQPAFRFPSSSFKQLPMRPVPNAEQPKAPWKGKLRKKTFDDSWQAIE